MPHGHPLLRVPWDSWDETLPAWRTGEPPLPQPPGSRKPVFILLILPTPRPQPAGMEKNQPHLVLMPKCS